MATENDIPALHEKITSIEKLIYRARDAHDDLLQYLREASQLADGLAFPCADKVAEYIDDAIFHAEGTEGPLDDADTQCSALFHLFHTAEAESILERCRGCIHWCRGCCTVIDDANELEHPCPDFEPTPPGFNCYQCTTFNRWHGVCSLKSAKIACPAEHCCSSFSPTNAPAADPNQPMLDL